MRVSFNTVQGRTFMIGSTETADVDLPDLEPGTYDVVLYDYAQEVDRLPKALTILPRVARANRDGVGAWRVRGAEPGAGRCPARRREVCPEQPRSAEQSSASARAIAGAVQMRTGETAIAVGLPGLYDVPAALELECFLESSTDGSLRCIVSTGPRRQPQWSPTRSCRCRWPAAR